MELAIINVECLIDTLDGILAQNITSYFAERVVSCGRVAFDGLIHL